MTKNDTVDFKVLDSISVIAKKLAGSNLKIKRTQEFLKAEEQLNNYFETTSNGTWMMCGIISYYFEHGCTCNFNDLSSFFDTNIMSVIVYKDDIKVLLDKGYISNTKGLDEKEVGLKNEFELSTELLHCILHNKKITLSPKKEKEDGLTSLIKRIGEMIESNEREILKIRWITRIEKKYRNSDFFSKVCQVIPDSYDRLFFYDTCSDLLNGNETNLCSTLSYIYDSEEYRFNAAESFLNEENALFTNGLIDFINKGNINDSVIELTPKAKEMLLGEKAKLFMKSTKGTNLINPEAIKQKSLFYSAENETEIHRLKTALQEENLRSIQERLSKKGLPKGIAVLLYGTPGTGKTETVYQIAKETGRQILHVDISSAKSCWFGESEKNIKKIFTDYKQLCKAAKSEKNGKMPILLFNEADGILSKRRDAVVGNTAQTENTIQNIILEEMETLEGIMICTTNLAENLDTAFERRFLFKIKFENPTIAVKQKIWKSKLGWLNDETISKVAQAYELSGGQIDNIVRKITMDEVLTGNKPDFEELNALCKSEKINNTERRIGFC